MVDLKAKMTDVMVGMDLGHKPKQFSQTLSSGVFFFFTLLLPALDVCKNSSRAKKNRFDVDEWCRLSPAEVEASTAALTAV